MVEAMALCYDLMDLKIVNIIREELTGSIVDNAIARNVRNIIESANCELFAVKLFTI